MIMQIHSFLLFSKKLRARIAYDVAFDYADCGMFPKYVLISLFS